MTARPISVFSEEHDTHIGKVRREIELDTYSRTVYYTLTYIDNTRLNYCEQTRLPLDILTLANGPELTARTWRKLQLHLGERLLQRK